MFGLPFAIIIINFCFAFNSCELWAFCLTIFLCIIPIPPNIYLYVHIHTPLITPRLIPRIAQLAILYILAVVLCQHIEDYFLCSICSCCLLILHFLPSPICYHHHFLCALFSFSLCAANALHPRLILTKDFDEKREF